MDMRRLVGRNVRRARGAAGCSQEKLAEGAGVSQQYVSNLETGKVNATVITLYMIAQNLGVSVADLVTADAQAAGDPPGPRPRPRRKAPD